MQLITEVVDGMLRTEDARRGEFGGEEGNMEYLKENIELFDEGNRKVPTPNQVKRKFKKQTIEKYIARAFDIEKNELKIHSKKSNKI